MRETHRVKTRNKLNFFYQKKKKNVIQASHLFPTQTKTEVLEISQAFVGEAGTALEAGDIGQRREVIVQELSSCRLYVQRTVAVTSCVGLQTGTFKYAGICFVIPT